MKNQILVLFFIISFFSHAFSQSIINVSGTADSLLVKKQVAQLLDYLDVNENLYLIIVFNKNMPRGLKGYTLSRDEVDREKINGYQVIKVGLDARLSKEQLKQVLAHEMIHVKQFAKGELTVLNNHQVLWKGKKFLYKTSLDYHLAPWEHEANNTAQLLALLDSEPAYFARSKSRSKNKTRESITDNSNLVAAQANTFLGLTDEKSQAYFTEMSFTNSYRDVRFMGLQKAQEKNNECLSDIQSPSTIIPHCPDEVIDEEKAI